MAGLLHVASALVSTIVAQAEGGTWNPRTRSLESFQDPDIYVVSLAGFEHPLPSMLFEQLELVEWLAKAGNLLQHPEYFVGWFREDNGPTTLDVSTVIKGRMEAIAFGI